MDETSDKSTIVLTDASNHGSKSFALNVLTNDFARYLRGIMSRSGCGVYEKELHHPIFKRFMLLTLSKSAEILCELIHRLSITINITEEEALKRLITKSEKIDLEPKLEYAMRLFSSDLPRYFKSVMHSAGYVTSETEEDHRCYVSFFSSAIGSLTNLFLRINSLKPDFQAPAQNNKRKFNVSDTLKCSNYENNPNKASTSKVPWSFDKRSLIQIVANTKKHLIYRVSNISSEDVLLKVIKTENPTKKDLKNLSNELEISKMIAHPSLRIAYERTFYQSKHALILEWVQGRPISEIDFVKTFNLGFFLDIAREIVSAMLALHMENLMHMDITSDHIITDLELKSLKLISFGSSICSGGKNSYFSKEELLDKDLRYISPEQTGRVNRKVDFRSDFYSLGVVLYRMLTGKYPFESDDTMKLIHMHILKDPLPVSNVNDEIPDALSNMVSILLKKNAEERYRSAKGIIYDLDFMISEHLSDEKLTTVLLQQHDTPENLLLPQKLYGRCDQYKCVLSAFDRVNPTSFEIVLVAGESGTGKTSMVMELYKSIAERDGIFLYGKYHLSASEPYGGLRIATKNFIDDILLRDKTTIARYKQKIQDSIGDDVIILTNFISNLHLLIDGKPTVSDTFGQDEKKRFIYVFIQFFKAICSVGPPIVLVLEDLHWLDLDSSNILSSLLTVQSNKNFMFIGTYRENDTSNIANGLFKKIKEKNTNVTQLRLGNVNHQVINDFISDALCVYPFETYVLTSFLYERTEGNLFFLNQMLKSLSEQGSIFFCNTTNKWKWDASIVKDNNFSETAIELIIEKINSLDDDTQDVFKFASCLGHSFSLGTLKYLVKSDKCIEDAICTGMITEQERTNSIYRFAHDQIQQAAFSSISKKNIKETFWSIGRKLWQRYSIKELDDNIFVVARLLYHSVSLASNENERFKIASLLMQAGKKAMSRQAFEQSFIYFYNGTYLLSRKCWKTHYDLTLELYNATAKSAFCISDYATLRTVITEIKRNVTSKLHLIHSYSLQIKLYKDKRMFEKAINKAIYILNTLGETLNINPDASDVLKASLEARNLVKDLTNEELMEIKLVEDKVSMSIMMILSDIVYSSFLVNRQLFCLVSARMTILTFKFGLSKYSAYGLCAFGAVLCGNTDNIGYQCGKLALLLLQKMQEKELTPLVYGMFYVVISPWYSSIHDSITPLKEMYHIGLNIGSQNNNVIGASIYLMYALLSGTNLGKLLDDIEEFKLSMPVMSNFFLCANQAVLNFRDLDKANPALIEGDLFDYQLCFDKNQKDLDISRCLVVCIFIACVFNDYTLALKLSKILRPLSKCVSYIYMGPIFLFYDGLASLIAASLQEGREKEILIQHAKENMTKLRKFSADAPENYLNKAYLLEAELAVVCNNKSEAISNFQRAIELSSKHNFLHEEAIFCERAAMFYIQVGFIQQATQSLLQSYNCFKKWGAVAKLKNLHVKFPTINFDSSAPLEINMEVEGHSTASISMLS